MLKLRIWKNSDDVIVKKDFAFTDQDDFEIGMREIHIKRWIDSRFVDLFSKVWDKDFYCTRVSYFNGVLFVYVCLEDKK